MNDRTHRQTPTNGERDQRDTFSQVSAPTTLEPHLFIIREVLQEAAKFPGRSIIGRSGQERVDERHGTAHLQINRHRKDESSVRSVIYFMDSTDGDRFRINAGEDRVGLKDVKVTYTHRVRQKVTI